jgi:hypothetical protein
MAYLDQYIVNHTDHTLRLVSALDAGRSALPVVRVGSREFQKYVDAGYRMYNPHNAAIGMHRVMQLTMPGYALANEFVGGHGSHSRLAAKRRRSNPDDIGQLGYTSWSGVQSMQKRAREMGQSDLVKVFPESDANYAHQKLSAALGKGILSHRITMAPFGVTDRPRVYGYAPEKWIEEDYDKVRGVEDAALSRQVSAMIAATKALKEEERSRLRAESARVQAVMDPQVAELERAVDAHIKALEETPEEAVETDSLTAERVVVARKSLRAGVRELKDMMVRMGRGAKEGWEGPRSGWEVDEPTSKGKRR